MNVIAHRGFSAKWPENSLAAFKEAAAVGANFVELDVQLCRSGEVVVMHDLTVDRTTSGTGAVEEFSLEEIKSLELIDKPVPPNRSLQRVPTLGEVFKVLEASDCRVLIELKFRVFRNGRYFDEIEGLSHAVVKSIKRHRMEAKVVIQSFVESYLATVKNLEPEIDVHLLVLPWRWTSSLLQMDYVDGFNANVNFVTRSFVRRVQESGRRTFVWTVNKDEQFFHAKSCGVDGVIGDDPERLLRLKDQKMDLKKTHLITPFIFQLVPILLFSLFILFWLRP